MKLTPSFLLLLIAGCFNNTSQPKTVFTTFRPPIIIQKFNVDTILPFKNDRIEGIYPLLVGHYKLTDTIHFVEPGQFGNISKDDAKWEISGLYEIDSLTSDGLQIIPDYNTSIAYKRGIFERKLFYPVYIVNETNQDKVFYGKDGHGYGIQEALDTSRYKSWHPIESIGYDFCGNGDFRKRIRPGEFLMFLLPKYDGSFNTLIRIRFQIGKNIFVSRAFKGIINPEQFNIDKRDWIYDRLKETKGEAASYLFYGGNPREVFE